MNFPRSEHACASGRGWVQISTCTWRLTAKRFLFSLPLFYFRLRIKVRFISLKRLFRTFLYFFRRRVDSGRRALINWNSSEIVFFNTLTLSNRRYWDNRRIAWWWTNYYFFRCTFRFWNRRKLGSGWRVSPISYWKKIGINSTHTKRW